MAGHLFGKSLARIEDPALLTGRGRFVDDIHMPGMLHAAFVRSPVPHAAIQGIDATAARAAPGVHAVLTFAEMKPLLTADRLSVGLPSKAYRQVADRPVLAHREACYAGEPIAVVVADSRYAAEDAAALVALDLSPLPAVADCRAALEPDAPKVHTGAPHNTIAEFVTEYGDTDGVFARARHVFRESLWQHRGISHAIECRGAVARYDPVDDRLTLWSGTQAPHTAARMLVKLFGWEENRIRVVSPDIGGGFGPKLVFYQEDVAVAVAARVLGRAVKWTEDRRENFLAMTQERDQFWDVEVAVDDTARILGVRGRMVHDHGAYTARGINLPQNSAQIMPGPYVVPCYRLQVILALTNKVPVSPVRGAGHPQGTFAMERLMDRIADELALPRDEVRRRNLVPADAIPYRQPIKSRGGADIVYDSGDYPACQAAALDAAGAAGFRDRQRAARADGRHIGLGLANYIKGTGRGPFESALVRVGPSGTISIYSGATAIGQGTRTMLAQICADTIGCDMEAVSVVCGDTATIALGHGAASSRQAVNAGNSVFAAAKRVREKLIKAAAVMLEAGEEDLDIAGRRIHVRGVPDLSIAIGDVADALAGIPGYGIPGGLDAGIQADENVPFEALNFAYGTTVAEVEVDAETGAVRILNYVAAHDSGRIINPMIVDGQIVGGIAHGIGNALYEWMGYDDGGQPLTTTCAEYMVPSATEVPRIGMVHIEIPTPHNPLGIKGVGESGVVPAAAALVSAIEDALSPWGIKVRETPIRPTRLVELIAAAQMQGRGA